MRNTTTRCGALVLIGVLSTAGCTLSDSDDQGKNPAARDASRILTKSAVDDVLPGTQEVPEAWTHSGGREAKADTFDKQKRVYGSVGYEAKDLGGTVGFGLSAYKTPEVAKRAFTESLSGTEKQLAVAGADQVYISEVDWQTTIRFRVGTVEAYVNYAKPKFGSKFDYRSLLPATRAYIDRTNQVLDGEEVTTPIP
ncbi:hypothetical protein ACFVFJ_45780 [Streptomyces sp. NPDC057717]|uniref:hypothetical protein n=1 Tax=Streptomyces sp. NPDC057717 TaxID=3346224 RepID=UPI00367A237F